MSASQFQKLLLPRFTCGSKGAKNLPLDDAYILSHQSGFLPNPDQLPSNLDLHQMQYIVATSYVIISICLSVGHHSFF